MDNCCGCVQQAVRMALLQANFVWPGFAPFTSQGFLDTFGVRYLTLTVNSYWNIAGSSQVIGFAASITADPVNGTFVTDPVTGMNVTELTSQGYDLAAPILGDPNLIVTATQLRLPGGLGLPDITITLSNPFTLAQCKAGAIDLLARVDLATVDYDRFEEARWKLTGGNVVGGLNQSQSLYVIAPQAVQMTNNPAYFNPATGGYGSILAWSNLLGGSPGGTQNIITIAPKTDAQGNVLYFVPAPFTHDPHVVVLNDLEIQPGTVVGTSSLYAQEFYWVLSKAKYKPVTADFCQETDFFYGPNAVAPTPPSACQMIPAPNGGEYFLDPPDLDPDTRDNQHIAVTTPLFGYVLTNGGCPCTPP